MGSAPTDLRLAGAAVGCWLTAALAVTGRSGTVVRVAVGVGLVAAVVWCVPVLEVGAARVRAAGMRASGAGAAGVRAVGVRTAGARAGGARAAVGLGLVAALAVLASVAAQLHVRESGPLDALVRERAVVDVVGILRSEPVPVAPGPWDTGSGEVGSGEVGQGEPDEPGTSEPRASDRGTAQPGERPPTQQYRGVLAVSEVTGRGRTSPAAAGVVVLGPGWDAVPYGARVAVTGRLAPVDPGDELRGMLVTWDAPRVVRAPSVLDHVVRERRSALQRTTDGFDPDPRGLVPGSAVGDTSRVPDDLDQAMRDVGLTHITAVSGGHFAVLWVGVLGVCATLRLPRGGRAGLLAGVMAGFVLLVHPEPSVLRAAAMGGVAVLGLLAGRPSRAVPALAAATIVLLILDPWLARSYGFVLSVLATAAIVLLGPPLAVLFGRLLPAWAATVLAVPTAAQAVCGPVLVLLSPRVSVYAVPANVLAAPALVPATLLGVLATVTAGWSGPFAVLLAHGAGWATRWIAWVARWFAALPGARWPWPSGVLGAVLLAVVTTVLLGAVLTAHRRAPARTLLVLLVGLVVLAPGLRSAMVGVVPTGWPPTGWRVVMCDVGQGDGLVVRTGPRSAVVVDVGPDGPAMDDCLDRLGVVQIDLLVLSHFHADHVGGLGPVLDGRRVAAALVSPLHEPAGQARRTMALLAAADVSVSAGVVGASGTVGVDGTAGQVRWTVLGPAAASGAVGATGGDRAAHADDAADDAEDGANDASLVVLLETGEVSVLTLGDLEPPGQRALAARLPATGIAVDVLKVAHHGSAHQSPRLTGLVHATLALVSVGADNGYGHPAPTTISALEATGATVLTTADCTDIAVGPGPPGATSAGPTRPLTVSAHCLG